jgi:hypothetical protein
MRFRPCGQVATKLIEANTMGTTLRALQNFSGGKLPSNVVGFLVHLFNGHICSGFARLCGCGKETEA